MNLRLRAILNCNTSHSWLYLQARSTGAPIFFRQVWPVSACPHSRADLIEQLLQAGCIARHAAEASLRVEVREFPDRKRENWRIHGSREFERCLRHFSHKPPASEDTKQFRIEPRRKLRIAPRNFGSAQLKKQPEAADQFGKQIETHGHQKKYQRNRRQIP